MLAVLLVLSSLARTTARLRITAEIPPDPADQSDFETRRHGAEPPVRDGVECHALATPLN